MDGRYNMRTSANVLIKNGSWNAEFTRAKRNLTKDHYMDEQSKAVYRQFYGKEW
jgi:hypothetical protein